MRLFCGKHPPRSPRQAFRGPGLLTELHAGAGWCTWIFVEVPGSLGELDRLSGPPLPTWRVAVAIRPHLASAGKPQECRQESNCVHTRHLGEGSLPFPHLLPGAGPATAPVPPSHC